MRMTNSRNPPHPRVCLSVCCWGPGQPGHQGDCDENFDGDENYDVDENVYDDVSYQVLKRIKWVMKVVMMIKTLVIIFSIISPTPDSKRCDDHHQGCPLERKLTSLGLPFSPFAPFNTLSICYLSLYDYIRRTSQWGACTRTWKGSRRSRSRSPPRWRRRRTSETLFWFHHALYLDQWSHLLPPQRRDGLHVPRACRQGGVHQDPALQLQLRRPDKPSQHLVPLDFEDHQDLHHRNKGGPIYAKNSQQLELVNFKSNLWRKSDFTKLFFATSLPIFGRFHILPQMLAIMNIEDL